MKKGLLFGVVEKIITPEIGCNLFGYMPDVYAESVNDDLTATAYYFAEGNTEALMVSVTVCVIDEDLAMRMRTEIEKKCGIAKEHIIIHATHTHSGPSTGDLPGFGAANDEYVYGVLVPAVTDAAAEAKASAEAVTVAVSEGDSDVAVNRREITEDGEVILGQNPWAPYDPRMTVVSFKNGEGEIKGSMVHYGCHGTAAGRNHEISRDWSGVMVDYVSEFGGGICAFFNGPEGDVGPRLMNGKTTGGAGTSKPRAVMAALDHGASIKMAMEHGAYAATDAVRIFRRNVNFGEATLEVSHGYIKIPVEPRIPLDFAKAEYEKYKDCTANQLGGYAAYLADVIKSYEQGYVEREYAEVEQIIVKIGEVAFVSSPFEMFSEIGLRIRKHSPVPYTLVLSNANGTKSYFPAESDICRGGYEVTMFKQKLVQGYTNNADTHLVKETVARLRSLKTLKK